MTKIIYSKSSRKTLETHISQPKSTNKIDEIAIQ